jgi:hypothetical protein
LIINIAVHVFACRIMMGAERKSAVVEAPADIVESLHLLSYVDHLNSLCVLLPACRIMMGAERKSAVVDAPADIVGLLHLFTDFAVHSVPCLQDHDGS